MACNCDSCLLVTVYSSESIDALKGLISCMSVTFGLTGTDGRRGLTAEDMFCFGVFCRDETYAEFKDWPEDPDFDIPCQLTEVCSTHETRMAYVRDVIDGLMCSGDERPEWMKYVEMEATEGGQQPSTFLRIRARDGRYGCMALELVNFLYSPSKTITMLGD